MKILLTLVLGLVSWLSVGNAQQIPTLDFFHGRECPHCQNEKAWFPTLKQAYPDLIINEYEVWHDPANQVLLQQRLDALGKQAGGVPTNIIDDIVIVGFLPDAILAALAQKYGPPAVDVSLVEIEKGGGFDYRLILIVLAGLGLAGGVAWLGKKS